MSSLNNIMLCAFNKQLTRIWPASVDSPAFVIVSSGLSRTCKSLVFCGRGSRASAELLYILHGPQQKLQMMTKKQIVFDHRCDSQSGYKCNCFENILGILGNYSTLFASEWLMKYCGRVCLEHLWLVFLRLKEQQEVGEAKRETTSGNKDDDCFQTKSESHARLY